MKISYILALFFIVTISSFANGKEGSNISIDQQMENVLFSEATKVNYQGESLPIMDQIFQDIESLFVFNGEVIGFEFADDYDVFYGYGYLNYRGDVLRSVYLYLPMFYLEDNKALDSIHSYSHEMEIYPVDETRSIYYVPYSEEIFLFEGQLLEQRMMPLSQNHQN